MVDFEDLDVVQEVEGGAVDEGEEVVVEPEGVQPGEVHEGGGAHFGQLVVRQPDLRRLEPLVRENNGHRKNEVVWREKLWPIYWELISSQQLRNTLK